MTITEYAAHRGVTYHAVYKAIKTKRIRMNKDRTINSAMADLQWEQNTDKTLQSRAQSHGKRPLPVIPAEDIKAINEAIEDESLILTNNSTFDNARTAKEILTSKLLAVRLAKANGGLVDRAKAGELFFNAARRSRDSLLGWPPRIAANMAAELGVDPHTLEQTLDKYLRQMLADEAEAPFDL